VILCPYQRKTKTAQFQRMSAQLNEVC